jgi:hypothetical protein
MLFLRNLAKFLISEECAESLFWSSQGRLDMGPLASRSLILHHI